MAYFSPLTLATEPRREAAEASSGQHQRASGEEAAIKEATTRPIGLRMAVQHYWINVTDLFWGLKVVPRQKALEGHPMTKLHKEGNNQAAKFAQPIKNYFYLKLVYRSFRGYADLRAQGTGASHRPWRPWRRLRRKCLQPWMSTSWVCPPKKRSHDRNSRLRA